MCPPMSPTHAERLEEENRELLAERNDLEDTLEQANHIVQALHGALVLANSHLRAHIDDIPEDLEHITELSRSFTDAFSPRKRPLTVTTSGDLLAATPDASRQDLTDTRAELLSIRAQLEHRDDRIKVLEADAAAAHRRSALALKTEAERGDAARDQVAALAAQLAATTVDNTAMQSRVVALEEEVRTLSTSLTSDRSAAQSSLDDTKQQLVDSAREVQRAKAECATLSASLRVAEEKNVCTTAALAAKEHEADGLAEDLAAAQQRGADIAARLEAAQAQLAQQAALVRERNSEVLLSSDQNASLAAALAAKEEEASRTSSALAAAEQRGADLSARLSTAEADAAERVALLAARDAAVEKLEQSLTSAEQVTTAAQQELQVASDMRQTLAERLAAAHKDIEHHVETAREQSDKLASVASERDGFVAKLQVAAAELRDATAAQRAAVERMEQATAARESLTARLAKAVADRTADTDDLTAQLARATADAEVLRASVHTALADRDSLAARLEKAAADATREKASADAARDKLDTTMAVLVSTRKELKELAAERAGLTSQLAEAEGESAKTKTAMEEMQAALVKKLHSSDRRIKALEKAVAAAGGATSGDLRVRLTALENELKDAMGERDQRDAEVKRAKTVTERLEAQVVLLQDTVARKDRELEQMWVAQRDMENERMGDERYAALSREKTAVEEELQASKDTVLALHAALEYANEQLALVDGDTPREYALDANKSCSSLEQFTHRSGTFANALKELTVSP